VTRYPHLVELIALLTVAVALSLATGGGSRGEATLALPDQAHPPIVHPDQLSVLEDLRPVGPAPACGADIIIASALVDPVELPDRLGEQLVLVNRSVEPVDLRDWQLVRGRRRLYLPSFPLEPGGRVVVGGPDGQLSLRPLQLPNDTGFLLLVDPCGLVQSRLAWGGICDPPPPGWRLGHPRESELGPARSVTGGAEEGGCGQT